MCKTVFNFDLFLIHYILYKEVHDVQMPLIPCTVISTIFLHPDFTLIVPEYDIPYNIITLFF